MHSVNPFDLSRIAQDLQIRKVQVESVVQLFEEGNSVPFVACYRKERTGGLNEETVRHISTRVRLQKQLADRKQTMLKSIENQGKLTDDLRGAILHAETSKRLEDLYLPFKPKKPGPASEARARGLEPLALAIWQRDAAFANLDEHWQSFVNPDKQLNTVDEVQAGVLQILAEMVAEKADVRAAVRKHLWENGKITAVKSEKIGEGQGLEYKDYFEFNETLRHIPPHRILALNRGEKEHALKIKIECSPDALREVALQALADAGLQRPRRRRDGRRREHDQEQTNTGEPETQAHGELAAESSPHVPPQPEHVDPTPPSAPPVEQSTSVPAESAAISEAAVPTEPVPTEAAQTEPQPAAPSVVEPPAFQVLPPDVGEPLSPHSEYRTPHVAILKTALEDALTRLLTPNLEREIRQELAEEAEAHSVTVLARNLRSLLLQPPLRNQRVLAIDPSFRTGCTIVALDEAGNVLEHTTIYPHTPHKGGHDRPRGKPRRGRSGKGGRDAKKQQSATPAAATAAPAQAADAAAESREQSPWASAAEIPQAAAPPIDTLPPMSGGQPDEGEAATTTADTVPAPVETAASNEAPSDTDYQEPEPAAVTPDVPTPDAEAVADPNAAPANPPVAAAEAAGVPPPPAPEKPPKQTPAERRAEAKARLLECARKNQVHVIAIGNGSGCRETEELISELIAEGMPDLAYVIVNEAGARIYSVSQTGREEFPDLDSTVRGTVSIGRRLQDPLSELVKVDPQHIGVGLYQHDVKRRELKELLDGVVESVVNQVGVDVNTANAALLRYVAGLNQMLAREIVEYRKQNGPFKNRQQLLQVPGMNEARFAQAAGFLKITDGDNPLDNTWIHPESYELATKILGELGYGPDVLLDAGRRDELRGKLRGLSPAELAARLNAGEPTVYDILDGLGHPSRDPREELPPPIFKKGILKLEDLKPGMELKGTVLNVVDFGVFVDIGLKESGLVHISQMANRYIKSPYDVVAVNDVVSAWVINVDNERHRVSLTMIEPGSERKPAERRPVREQRPPRDQGQGQQSRPPQGERRPPPRGRGPGQDQGRPPQRGQGGPRRDRPPQTGSEAAATPRPAPPPPPPPKPRPRRAVPQPKLSKAALEGKVPLRTFSELSALFAAKKEDPAPAPTETPPPVEAAPPQPAAVETPTVSETPLPTENQQTGEG